MNADGSPRVAVDASIGAKLDDWAWVGVRLLIAGLLFAFAAAGLIHLGVRRTQAPAQPGTVGNDGHGDTIGHRGHGRSRHQSRFQPARRAGRDATLR